MSKPVVYYKATRPDGTDFKTGKVLYEVGKRSRPEYTNREPSICGPGYLHAADVPAMTLIGGSWPCRLFEVTGKSAAGFDGVHAHKGGFRQLTVVREIDPHLALGPNGRYVAGVIERTKSLSYDEALQMRAARDAARDAAWRAARDAAWRAARDAAMRAARDAAMRAARRAAMRAARRAAWGAARDAAWDAASALLVQDLITSEQFDILCGPWEKVLGKEFTR